MNWNKVRENVIFTYGQAYNSLFHLIYKLAITHEWLI